MFNLLAVNAKLPIYVNFSYLQNELQLEGVMTANKRT